LVFWSVWLALSASLCALIYVAASHEIPVPGFVLRQAEGEMARAGLVIKFGRARFDPSGKLMFEDVQVRAVQFGDPLLSCRKIYLRFDPWSVLAGRPLPEEVQLEGAVLQLPAILSPSGVTEPLARDLTLILRHQGNRWLVDDFSGHVGPVVVTAQGELAGPSRPAGGAALSPADIVARYVQISRQVATGLHQLDSFLSPSLALHFGYQDGVGNTAEMIFTAAGASKPAGQPVTLGPLAATASLRLDGSIARRLRLHVALRDAVYAGRFAADSVRAVITAEIHPDGFSVRPQEVLLAVAAIHGEGEALLGAVVRADLSRWPALWANVAGAISGEVLAAEVEAEVNARTAVVRAEGRASPQAINRVLAAHTPRAAPYFVFGDPVAFHAVATLGPEWKFATLAARTAAGRIDSHGVKITAARGRIDIVGRSFLAHDAEVTMGDNLARGSYWMDFGTLDYRMLLDGRLRPAEINGWFHGDWWLGFWNKNFSFTGAPPEGDVDVQGSWHDPARTVFFGRANGTSVAIWGGTFENVRATVFVRPNFTHAYAIDADRAAGTQRLQGWFKRLANPATHETNRIEFNFDSSVEAATIGRLLEGRATEVLASLALAQPPQVHAEGAVAGEFPNATPEYSFNAKAEGGVHYFGFPVDSAQVIGRVSGNDVLLDDIQFSVAGGRGAGKAAITGPADTRQLGFELKVSQADLARTIRAVEEYDGAHTGQKAVPGAENKFMQRASGGRLDLAMAATGKPGEIATFTGNGTAALGGVELAEIHLFGVLSKALSGLSLNFSSLKLDAATTSFRLEGGRLNFPDLKITGPSAVIDARGNFTFATKQLDFTAKLKPFEKRHTLLQDALSVVVSPITSILELKLTGPVSNPDWSIVVGQSAPRPEAAPADPNAATARPGAPAAAGQNPAPVTPEKNPPPSKPSDG
jgi:hypothetical protein